jgi:hypothetical protein
MGESASTIEGSTKCNLANDERSLFRLIAQTVKVEQILTKSDTLTGGKVLPGFSLLVRRIFET